MLSNSVLKRDVENKYDFFTTGHYEILYGVVLSTKRNTLKIKVPISSDRHKMYACGMNKIDD
jgi:hypothetical protein